MKIGPPELVQADGALVYQVAVNGADGERRLWYQVDAEYGGMVSDRSDAALAALLVPAMARGEDIELTAPVSEQLYHNLAGRYQRILELTNPRLARIQVHAQHLRPSVEGGQGVATGFSSGVDSFCVLADHHYAPVSPGFRLTHLLHNNVGSHGIGGEALFQERHEQARAGAQRIGLPLIAVNSNVDAFYEDRPGLTFPQTHTPRNVSVALLLQRGLGRFLYASAYSDKQILQGGDLGSSGGTDPFTLPLLSTEGLTAMSVGGEYSRIEKTLRVAEVPDSWDMLDVCAAPRRAGNCSRCWKCMRTMLTLELAGMLERYEPVFDLPTYRQHRTEYLAWLTRQQGALERELLDFVRERGYPLPGRLRVWCQRQGRRIGNRMRRWKVTGRWTPAPVSASDRH